MDLLRKTNNAHLRFMENHRVTALLTSLTVVGGLVHAIGWLMRDRSFGAADSRRGPDRGQFFIQKQYLTARSGLFAANAYMGNEAPFLSPKEMEVASRQSRKSRIDAGDSPSDIPSEGWWRGYSAATIRQAYENKGVSSSYKRIVFDAGTYAYASVEGSSLLELEELLENTNRVMVRTNKTGAATDGHWICFRKDGDASWVLLDSAKKFSDLARGYHSKQGPVSYIAQAFGKGDCFCDVIMPHQSGSRPAAYTGDHFKKRLHSLTSDGAFASALRDLPSPGAGRDYAKLLATVSDVVDGGLRLDLSDRMALSRELYALGAAVKESPAFTPDHYNEMCVLADAYRQIAAQSPSDSSPADIEDGNDELKETLRPDRAVEPDTRTTGSIADIEAALDRLDQYAKAAQVNLSTKPLRDALEKVRSEGLDERAIEGMADIIKKLRSQIPKRFILPEFMREAKRKYVVTQLDAIANALKQEQGRLRGP